MKEKQIKNLIAKGDTLEAALLALEEGFDVKEELEIIQKWEDFRQKLISDKKQFTYSEFQLKQKEVWDENIGAVMSILNKLGD